MNVNRINQHNRLYAKCVYKCLHHFFSHWGAAQRFLQILKRVCDHQRINNHKSRGFPLSVLSISQRVDVTYISGLRVKKVTPREALERLSVVERIDKCV